MNFYVKTYGCKLNQADSEIIKGFLSKEYKETSKEDADFVILNTCGVIEKTERKIIKEAKDLKKKGKKVIIAGCLPMISLEECQKVADGIIGPSNLLSILLVVKKALKGEKLIETKKENIDKSFYYGKEEKSSLIVPIAEGCLGNCSYCTTKIARKNLVSFSPEKIIERIKNSKAIEVQITSQDLSVYGMEKGSQSLVSLLKEIIKIDRDFKIKLGMMNPGYTLKIMNELFDVFDSEKIYKFIHLPLQSGSDDLLRKMRRPYLSKDFVKISKAFRKRFKETIIATDIIVGHPSETKEDFEKTVKIVKKVKPEVVHIFKFSKRKETEDFKLKDLPDRIKKDRSRVLSDLCKNINIEKNKKYLNKTLKALVVEKRNQSYLARTDSGRAIIVKNGIIGKYYKIKIIDYKWNYLIGEV